MLDPSKLIDDDNVPFYFTKENATLIGGSFEERKIEIFEKLHKTYTKHQVYIFNRVIGKAKNHWLSVSEFKEKMFS